MTYLKGAEFDAVVIILRGQPLTEGHGAQIKRAAEKGKTVVMLVGSSNRIRGQRNPFTYEERKEMIRAYLATLKIEDIQERVRILPLPDRVYDLTAWLQQVHSLVIHALFDSPFSRRIAIAGHASDNSADYKDMFPQWEFLPMPGAKEIEATQLRDKYLAGAVQFDDWWKARAPETTIAFLHQFRGTAAYGELLADREAIIAGKAKYGEGPFVAADAMLVQSGNVLLIERGKRPSQGAWALPGGFLDADKKETLYDCAIRELFEETAIGETGLTKRDLGHFYRGRDTFDDPYRSERGIIISGAFIFELPPAFALPKVRGTDDAQSAFWKPLAEIEPTRMFDDHAAIIETLLPRLQNPNGGR